MEALRVSEGAYSEIRGPTAGAASLILPHISDSTNGPICAATRIQAESNWNARRITCPYGQVWIPESGGSVPLGMEAGENGKPVQALASRDVGVGGGNTEVGYLRGGKARLNFEISNVPRPVV